MKALMIQGTASGVGKSVLVAGLCRLLARNGVRVAPFKPQNMSNNAAVTIDGGEIGRAQALQALACGIEPTVHMNPVLIKPEGDEKAQLVVRGKVVGSLEARRFREDRIGWMQMVLDSFAILQAQYDVVIVEGAGSPAEPNLREGDIANMGFAEAADVPVWLVGDIDCGGVFAALSGSLYILSTSENGRVKALLINRFRGNLALLDDALIWLEEKTGRPVAGVIPYLPLELPEEDAPYRHQNFVSSYLRGENVLRIAVIAYPRMSNSDDIDPLASEAGVQLRFVRSAEELSPADLIILPGSKHVASDLAWLRAAGFVPELERHLRYGGKLLGLCGGMQMLGLSISDDAVDGACVEGGAAGLAWLPVSTTMQSDKILRQVDQLSHRFGGHRVTGYEIHHGTSEGATTELFPFFACSDDKQVWGSYLHGLFEQGAFRQSWLAEIFEFSGDGRDQQQRTLASLDLLADALEQALDVELLSPLLATANMAKQVNQSS
ncbi:MAG: cobyric acid synthase CobQ [Zetaproteobacteria bacterium CG_4_9_14_3_um_filter_49_83]|nr:MAG: cobyric acid synthase CobQ [Zetaproteobacteria bacterium CG1_02_49_23]PIQ31338.1 MAG: cobyric acid synthase CobQ [Zetaproteobacteria bacterium CG17_big_fil_post_rev_8_21_14_2_50_50_13]PIY55368.1 MAG: cobyric acid synthase CobQ [Zetaproteobacteria bacterium CG_4_10_14_0_8_um_filter_49_80]PJA34940.1 MAG: cobyric acid synthase CobQ [Zetaproteobacteria bacterium CG_4_9_14_3_um_filter_49_83]